MRLATGRNSQQFSLIIPAHLYEEVRYSTLRLDEKENHLEHVKEGIVWLIYQDANTLVLASDFYLKDRMGFKPADKVPFYTMRRIFCANARVEFMGMDELVFPYDSTCGISKKELERAVCFVEDQFVKIGLRG